MNLDNFIKKDKVKVYEIKYRIIKKNEKEDSVVIYLDNKEKINVSIETYFNTGINKIEGLDDNIYEMLKKEESLFLAYRGALRKLSTKDFTIKQIKDYLKLKKELNENEIEDLIKKLTSYGLLDDEKYCINRSNYLNKQLLSYKQIKIKLAKEGIDKDLIEKYVINNSEDEYIKAAKIAQKYSNSIKNKSLNATKQAILNKLVNSGYNYEASKDAINSLDLKNTKELELLAKEYNKAYVKYSKKYEKYDLKNHIYSYLINKGFKSDDIKSIMEV